ncbi:hypothetical protein FRC17_007792 [Serendipita sp. 399]|nr:hypothetical protein FRC17_007792 [Serendipita sp. 399]
MDPAIHHETSAAERVAAAAATQHASIAGQRAQPSTASSYPPSTYPRYDQMAQNYSPSQAADSVTNTSHHRIRGHPSRAANVWEGHTDTAATTDQNSFYSYNSQDATSFVKEIDGRIFNAQSELYMMPSDNGEFQRLDKQHYAFVLALGGLYPCRDVVESILGPSNRGEPRSILDLGSGSGIWAIEMARNYPNAAVVALDLAPSTVDPEAVPPNCRFEIDDINLGLTHYHGQFDVIHARCIGSGLANYGEMMLDVEACLKPGGIAIFIDGDMTMYQEDMVTPIKIGQDEGEAPGSPGGSWLARLARGNSDPCVSSEFEFTITKETRYAAILNGSDIDGLEDRIDEGMWDHSLIDPSSVRVASLFTPVGPWLTSQDPHEQQQLQYIGSLLRQDFIVWMRMGSAWHALLRKYGIAQEQLTEWLDRAVSEVEDTHIRMFWRWRFTWGIKRPDENEEDDREEDKGEVENKEEGEDVDQKEDQERIEEGDEKILPSLSEAPKLVATTPEPQPKTHNLYHVYCSKEDALRAMEARKEKARHLPIPLVNIIAQKSRVPGQ